MVASTSLFETPTTASNGGKDPRIGVVLVVFGCIAQGVQYVFEEKVMKVDNAPPLVVIGMEGLWGTFLSLFFIYPIAYMLPGSDNGSYESPMDAITMIQNSKMLQVFTITFVLTVTVYNCMAIYVTKYLSAIWHAILDNFRPVTIWGLDLAIFYVIAPNQGSSILLFFYSFLFCDIVDRNIINVVQDLAKLGLLPAGCSYSGCW